MIEEDELLVLVEGLKRRELSAWVAAGWVLPARHGPARRYREVDVARVRLIVELRRDFRLNDEGVEVVLSLLDQIHGLRGELRALAAAVAAQPEPIRRDVARRLRGARERPR